MRIRNVSPVGDLDVPLLRRVVAAGEVIEVSEAHGARLLEQSIWEPAAAEDEEGVTDGNPAI